MRAGVIGLVGLVLGGGSTAAACERTVEQPIVVNASQSWSSVPTTTTYRPVMISAPPQYRIRSSAAPVYTPLPPPTYVPIGTHSTYKPLRPITPMPAQYRFGRGIVGQPKVYVPGQPIRNFLRFLSP